MRCVFLTDVYVIVVDRKKAANVIYGIRDVGIALCQNLVAVEYLLTHS